VARHQAALRRPGLIVEEAAIIGLGIIGCGIIVGNLNLCSSRPAARAAGCFTKAIMTAFDFE
jgi:hypothetical protein